MLTNFDLTRQNNYNIDPKNKKNVTHFDLNKPEFQQNINLISQVKKKRKKKKRDFHVLFTASVVVNTLFVETWARNWQRSGRDLLASCPVSERKWIANSKTKLIDFFARHHHQRRRRKKSFAETLGSSSRESPSLSMQQLPLSSLEPTIRELPTKFNKIVEKVEKKKDEETRKEGVRDSVYYSLYYCFIMPVFC